ncbi:MAG: hypothetical protein KC502_15805 [Myxococcales bacterium]|nr:hypothetical protein [Myxococcales bacterium]
MSLRGCLRQFPRPPSASVIAAIAAALVACGGGQQVTIVDAQQQAAAPRTNPPPAEMLRHQRAPVIAVAQRAPGRLTTRNETGFEGARTHAKSAEANTHLQIVMYGSGRCGICKGFRARMERDGIRYTWVDILQDSRGRRTMWRLVQKAKPGARSVRFPVMTLGKRILVSPRYSDFERVRTK